MVFILRSPNSFWHIPLPAMNVDVEIIPFDADLGTHVSQ